MQTNELTEEFTPHICIGHSYIWTSEDGQNTIDCGQCADKSDAWKILFQQLGNDSGLEYLRRGTVELVEGDES